MTNRQDTQLCVSVTYARKNASLKRAHLSEIMVPQKTPTRMSVKAFPLKSSSQEQMVENRGVWCPRDIQTTTVSRKKQKTSR